MTKIKTTYNLVGTHGSCVRHSRSSLLHYALCIVHYALLLVFLPACTQTEQDSPDTPDFEEGIPTEVTITISARPNHQTRAEEHRPMDPTSSVELIHDWWIAFVNEKKEAVKIITREQVQDKVTSTSVNVSGGGFEAETFRTVLPAGTYRIYTFANIPYKTEAEFKAWMDWTSDEIPEYKLKDKYIKDFVTETPFGEDVMQWPSDKKIPMSGTFTQVIDNTVDATLNFEVVRAVVKVEFAFSNPSTDEITLTELKIGRISKGGKISIVPNYSAIGKKANDKLKKNIKEKDKGTLTFSDLNSLVKKTGTDSNDLGSFSFYCKESLGGFFEENGDPVTQDNDTANAPIKNVFKIQLKVNKKKSGETTATEVSKTFYTSKITYINRNDWIKIPITFNNWVIKWKLHTYPPIGGYPPVFNQSGSGETLKATMTTGGEFELYPESITQNGKPYTVDWSKDVTVNVESGPELFISVPTLKENKNNQLSPVNSDKVIAGELDPKKEGTAQVRINFYLKDSEENEVAEVKTCLFTIHRQNSTP